MRTSLIAIVALVIVVAFAMPRQAVARGAAKDAVPFGVQVIDDLTGRGVPLVELETTSKLRYVTDSAGYAAIDAPELLNQKAHFRISSFGYEYPADGFGIRGAALDVKSGEIVTLKIKRTSVAERLYRITGAGIYADSLKLGKKAPIEQPLLNAQVVGQDSVQSAVYRDRLYFFWGDTAKLSYPLGLFQTAGATIDWPGKGGLDPSVGLNLHYFSGKDGFARAMAPHPGPGVMWLGGFVVINDDQGHERMLAHASRMKDLGTRLERSLVVFNDDKQVFEQLKVIDLDAPLAPDGHPFRATRGGKDHVYFPAPYPAVRVPATWQAVTDLAQYEGYTCLRPGTRFDKDKPDFDRDSSGNLLFAWKKGTPPLMPKQLEDLVKAGRLKREELPHRLTDIDTGKPIQLHGSSVAWNDFRQKWIMIGLQVFGDSMLGEIYFAEASDPEGSWMSAKKIVTHAMPTANEPGGRAQHMDFYNPRHHPFFDQQGGRIIYFEGTYTTTFSGNPVQTPRYEYNQVMYRLDLTDARLKLSS
ncbi:MAG: hypothetical protein ABIP55_04570 [Tepidisphaeraceae bacterium]